jgi:DNA-binding MarR family transcriptional regulator
MTEALDTQFLETLQGYNTRRAALSIINTFMQRMEAYELSPVDFSILSLIHHNPGVTSRQLCHALGLLPPNMVVFLKQFEKRHLIVRSPHPNDGRATALALTSEGKQLMKKAEKTAIDSDHSATARLTAKEQETLMRLLKKIYLSPASAAQG